ncbi:heme oxygenase [Chryseobacterium sp. Leaf180]|uniref:biliverdin-producing heme oxygenase n=1 Tax=Chryseobacterium sp. Leaf180 TaxID=1736289 RepID=UPI00070047FA|nr:biliverdin-producing heme oxygenase [Chryseobacterium sp. Leaf180]KQR92491.1 heme oxygenase [Chryseobacterium sp. Leaf180]
MTVSEYLKQNTAHYHDAAEEKFNSKKIFSKTFTLEDYRKMIGSNHKMLHDSEDEIFEMLTEKFGKKLQLEDRRKLSLIEKDADSLKLPKLKEDSDLKFENEYEALGAMYVIEGSTLGGNVIAKQLSKTEGFEEVTFHFFGCYRENIGAMWKNFKEVMDAEVKEEHFAEVLKGAKKQYSHLLAE